MENIQTCAIAWIAEKFNSTSSRVCLIGMFKYSKYNIGQIHWLL